MSKPRIRRRVTVNGAQVWITAYSEQEYAENVVKALAGGTVSTEPEKHDFAEYALKWFHTFSEPNVAMVTAITYERQLENHIIPSFAGRAIEDIKTADVQNLFNSIKGAKETKLKMKMVLNMIFNQAVDDELIVRNPLGSKNLRITGRNPKVTEPYSLDQMRQIAMSLPKVNLPMDRLYLALQAFHPLRLEETLGLTYGDIDLEKMTVHIQRAVTHPDRNMPFIKETKTQASNRTIALVPHVAQLVHYGAQDHFLIGGERPLSYIQVRHMHNRIKKDIGFSEPISPRRFRTTVLTDIYDSTKDIKQAQAAAGHTTATMTLKHYVKGRTENSSTATAISDLYGLSLEGGM